MDCPDAIMGLEEPGSSDGVSQEASLSLVSSSVTKVQTSPGGLRTVTVPEDLISKFLEIAKANSDRNIETLGTFGGQLCNNKFRVTHLLIPKQQGQSDSCTMEGYEDVLELHEKENLTLLDSGHGVHRGGQEHAGNPEAVTRQVAGEGYLQHMDVEGTRSDSGQCV